MDLDFSQFHQSFFEESLEMLEDMEKALLQLDPAQPFDHEKVNQIFRAAHSIKGGSATFGFNVISEFTHAVESFLALVRDNKRILTQEELNLLLKAVDCVRQLIDDLKQQRVSNLDNVQSLQTAFTQLLKKPADKAVSNTPAVTKSDHWKIEFQPSSDIFLTGNDPLRMLQVLAEWGPVQTQIDITQLPPFEQIEPERCYLSWHIQLNAAVEQQSIEEVFEWVSADSRLEITAVTTPVDEVIPAKQKKTAPSEQNHPDNSMQNQNKAENNTIRIATSKVDALINIIGELTITRSALTQLSTDFKPEQVVQLREILAQLELNCQELQQQALRIRMLPVNSIFNRFPRLIRDCSQKVGKQVNLQIEGEQTEIDKSMLEKLVDPLQHLLRNAVAHGIEMPAEREALGKPIDGLIKLKVYQQGGSIIIAVTDDGAGLSREKIRAKALENHLIEAEDILTDAQLYDLILKPGFSTAETTTELSGRGVGMDVVMQNIHALGGSIAIESIEGKGTTFTLRLPLTLAIMDCQITKVSGQTYIIPLNTMVEILKIEPDCLEQLMDGNKLYQLRGKYIPIINLKELFSITSAVSPDIQEQFLIVVEIQEELFGLQVDELLTQQQIVIKSLEDNYQKIPGIAGATILGDGSVALVIDVNQLIMSTRQNIISQQEATAANKDKELPVYESKSPDEVLQVLNFKLANQEYAIDILNVMEIRLWEQATPLPRALPYVTGIINLRGLIVPVIDLHQYFNLADCKVDEKTAIVILKLTGQTHVRLVGVIVDAVSDTYSFTYKDIQPVAENNDVLLKHAVLGLIAVNNKLVTLLHTHDLLPSVTIEHY